LSAANILLFPFRLELALRSHSHLQGVKKADLFYAHTPNPFPWLSGLTDLIFPTNRCLKMVRS